MQRTRAAVLLPPHNKKPIRKDGLLRFNLKTAQAG
jgi:hypothetical protein